MASTKTPRDSATRTPKEKTVDLPPRGPRNLDPITDAAGSHPIETGVGAAVAGAAAGALAGAVGGPLGAVAGAIAGGAAVGGVAGHAVGEMIDPTFENEWVAGYTKSKSKPPSEAEIATLRRAFRYGMNAQSMYSSTDFREVESDLQKSWERLESAKWDTVRDAVRAGFDRTYCCSNPM